MQQKFIAIGVAVVVVLAAVGGGVALVANSNHDDSSNNNKAQTTDFSGKWNLSYIEMANLIDESGKAIQNADDVKIFNRFLNPDDGVFTLNITSVGIHGFKGVISQDSAFGQSEDNIHGTINGLSIRFTNFNDELGILSVYHVVYKGDYLTTSVISYKLPDEGNDHSIVCGAGYMLFIRDGSTPVHPRVDYVDMGVMKVAEHIKGTLHMVTDFTDDNGTGRGEEISGDFEYSHAGNMITVFKCTDPDVIDPVAGTPDYVGVMAVVSLGVTPNGTAAGRIAGNMEPHIDGAGYVNSTFSGHMYMSHGKATFLMHAHHENMEDGPEFVELEFNVPYYKGGKLTPVYISEKHPYTGTVTIRTSADKDPETHDVKRHFEVYDNTFYSEITVDGHKVIWFGEIYGHRIDMTVLKQNSDGSYAEAGRFSGHVEDNGRIHLFGLMHGSDDKTVSFVDIDIGVAKS